MEPARVCAVLERKLLNLTMSGSPKTTLRVKVRYTRLFLSERREVERVRRVRLSLDERARSNASYASVGLRIFR